MSKTKIAIACQGGGAQTAFTAGVLKTFFENGVHRTYDIMSLSGTSGGAVCAALAWYGLLKAARGDATPIEDRLTAFWEELSAQHPQELFLDRWCAEFLRMVDKGWMPMLELSPADLPMKLMFGMLQAFLPRHLFTDLKAMLEKHIDFAEARRLVHVARPRKDALRRHFRRARMHAGLRQQVVASARAHPPADPGWRAAGTCLPQRPDVIQVEVT